MTLDLHHVASVLGETVALRSSAINDEELKKLIPSADFYCLLPLNEPVWGDSFDAPLIDGSVLPQGFLVGIMQYKATFFLRLLSRCCWRGTSNFVEPWHKCDGCEKPLLIPTDKGKAIADSWISVLTHIENWVMGADVDPLTATIFSHEVGAALEKFTT